MEKKFCSICGKIYFGYGNNAKPINDGRCCDTCNEIVIFRRIQDHLYRKEKQELGNTNT